MYNQEISCYVWTQEAHCCAQKRPSTLFIQSQMNPIHSLTALRNKPDKIRQNAV